MTRARHIDLFSGIGGFALAAHLQRIHPIIETA